MAVMTVSEARAALPEVLDRVEGGEEITITRHGRPVAVVIRPDIIWSRSRADVVMTQAAKLHDMLASASETAAQPTGLTEQYAAELIAAVHADRDRR